MSLLQYFYLWTDQHVFHAMQRCNGSVVVQYVQSFHPGLIVRSCLKAEEFKAISWKQMDPFAMAVLHQERILGWRILNHIKHLSHSFCPPCLA